MDIGFGTLFWGGIFVALTATAIAIVAIYYLVHWLCTISRRRTSRGNRMQTASLDLSHKHDPST